MNRILIAALLALPLAVAHAKGDDHRSDRGKPDKPGKPPKGQPVGAPEIDGGSVILALALAGGGLILLRRSRRKSP